jgi:tetratricopeptide (TPR) repeat protein
MAAACVCVCVVLAGCSSGGRGGGEQRSAAVAAPVEPAQASIDQARDLRAAGREDEALALLSRAIELNPTLTVAHLEVAEIQEEKGDFTAAERSYSTAAVQQPANFDAQYGHGRVLQALNRLAESVRAYLRALALRPDHFEANLNLAMAYIDLDGPAQALPYAQRAVQLNPADGTAHANLGAIYSSLGRHREAVEEYQQAAELMPLTPALLLNWASALGKLERYEEMVNILDASLGLEPSAQAYERLGFAQFKLRRYEPAMAAFRRAIEVDPNHYPALNGLGVCLLNRYILSNKQDVEAHNEGMDYLKRSLRSNQRQPRIVELVSRYER